MRERSGMRSEQNRRNLNRSIRTVDAADERQYMIREDYEVYEKAGSPVGALSFHYHNFYEIIYILEGEFSSMVEERTYNLKKGDFLLIDCNIMHKYHYVEKKHDTSRRIILWITEGMLEALSGELDLKSCFKGHGSGKEYGKGANGTSCAYHFPIYYEEMLRGYLLKLAMDMLPDVTVPGAKKILDRGYLTLFFGYLNVLCAEARSAKEDFQLPAGERMTYPLVETVSEYIEAHLQEKVTLDELASEVHMSKYHFLRRFKELTGMTVHAFLTNKRLIRACEALKEGKSVTRVYQETGFSEYSSFLRNFQKAFGVAPGKYKDFYS